MNMRLTKRTGGGKDEPQMYVGGRYNTSTGLFAEYENKKMPINMSIFEHAVMLKSFDQMMNYGVIDARDGRYNHHPTVQGRRSRLGDWPSQLCKDCGSMVQVQPVGRVAHHPGIHYRSSKAGLAASKGF